MAGFAQSVRPSELNDFVLAVRQKLGKGITDIVSTAHPIYKMLEATAGGIRYESPGLGPVEDVLAATEDRTMVLSMSSQVKEKSYAPTENFARAYYDWLMLVTTMMIPKMTYLNWQNAEQAFNYVKEKQAAQDISVKTKIVNMIWHGLTEGQEYVNGLDEIVQFVTTTAPTRGSVGRMNITKFPTWKNKTANYNGAFATYSSGTQVKTFLDDGANSLLGLYMDCGNTREGEKGQENAFPNLAPCNAVLYRYLHQLAEKKLIFRDQKQVDLLGVDSFRWNNAAIFYDPDCPDDPNVSTYGVIFLLNTSYLSFVKATGIEKLWSAMAELPNVTAYGCEETTQCSFTTKDRRRHGVCYGIQPISVS
jgi:hypothetical protein